MIGTEFVVITGHLLHVDTAAAGTWRIDVVGSNVPRGPQDFALVAIGRF